MTPGGIQATTTGFSPSGTEFRRVFRYEDRLHADPRWALTEGSLYFEGHGSVHHTLRKLTTRLGELGIPYAVVGGLALFRYGFRRFTEDVDLLVTPENLKIIHDRLEGRGYLPPFARSKNLRDTETGVKIEFLVSGQFPGDGKPKPVAFPDPGSVNTELEGIRYLNLPNLIELKLASGMTATDRLKDLVDVQELIRLLGLSRDYAEQLQPFVRGKFGELWQVVYGQTKRYRKTWRNKWLTANARSVEDMARALENAAAQLRAMQADGITLDLEAGIQDDYAELVTTDPAVARKYDMEDESEIWDGPGDRPPESSPGTPESPST